MNSFCAMYSFKMSFWSVPEPDPNSHPAARQLLGTWPRE